MSTSRRTHSCRRVRNGLALLTLALVSPLWGCDPGPDLVGTSNPPQRGEAASPKFLTPASQDEVITLLSDRTVVYKHTGTKKYSGATTQINDFLNVPVLAKTDKEIQYEGYYSTSALNQNDFKPSKDGRYIITATYYTYSPNFSENNQGLPSTVAQRPGSRRFKVCASGNFDCTSGSSANGGSSETQAFPVEECDQGHPTELVPVSCGGGGGGGGTTRPYALRRVPLTASMGPFFVLTNVGSSVSRSEAETAIRRLPSRPLDDVARIISEAYNKDIYEYRGVKVPQDLGPSPFLTLSTLLTSRTPVPTGMPTDYLSFVSELQADYVAAAETEMGVNGAVVSTAPMVAASLREVRDTQATVAVWPNPTADRVSVVVPGAESATAVSFYDILGRRVARIDALNSGGTASVVWDLSSETGGRVASGVYTVVVESEGTRVLTTRVTVL